MNLLSHANIDTELAGLSIDCQRVHEFGALAPVTATPVAIAAGVAAGAAVIGAAAGGAALGDAID